MWSNSSSPSLRSKRNISGNQVIFNNSFTSIHLTLVLCTHIKPYNSVNQDPTNKVFVVATEHGSTNSRNKQINILQISC
uniref:Uncharacterized protein n=1 Tax=Oryza brachyantha TaxID=4533 RepID=J3M6F2_ORYBR